MNEKDQLMQVHDNIACMKARPLAKKSTGNQRKTTAQNTIIESDNYRLKYSVAVHMTVSR